MGNQSWYLNLFYKTLSLDAINTTGQNRNEREREKQEKKKNRRKKEENKLTFINHKPCLFN